MNDKLESYSDFYECSLQLVPWTKGTDLLGNTFKQVKAQAMTLCQLLHWKHNYLLFPKPTLITAQTFVFWIHTFILDSALRLTGVQGGFKVAQKKPLLPDSSTYKGKKRRVLKKID